MLAAAAAASMMYTDSACEPRNPGGRLTWAWWASDPSGEILGEACGEMGQELPAEERTNNLGEMTAVLHALRWAYKQGYREVTLRTDSQLVVNQVTGVWSCNAANLYPIVKRLKSAGQVMTIHWEWIRRDANWRADELSRQVYAEPVGKSA